MHFLALCVLSSLALFACTTADVEKTPDKDMSLRVIRPDGSRFLRVRCNMIPYRTYLSKIHKVEVFAGDDMDGETGPFKRLAVIKKGWCAARVTSRVEDEGAATGEISADVEDPTFLEFEWLKETGGYCKSYECVATGIDHQGNPATIFTLNRVKNWENKACTSDNSGCFC